jgi:hypothetical protein
MENRAMDTQEEWVKLQQHKIPEGQFVVTRLVQDSDGTRIILDDDKNIIEIFFDGVPFLIRIATEGIRMRTWSEIQLKYQDKLFFRNWFFYQVQNSKLVEWAIGESCDIYDSEQLTHYCIVTSEELIDILASFEPIITLS